MTRYFDVVTFDCYGTLIDWEEGIVSAFTREAAADGVALAPSRILAVYHEVEPEVEASKYRPYREVLAETARRVADRLGWTLSEERAQFLPASLAEWRPFPDTNPALIDLVRPVTVSESCRTWTTIFSGGRGATSLWSSTSL